MRRQCAKAADHWAQGMVGWLASFYVGLARGFADPCLHEKGNVKAMEKVGGGLSTRLAGHVAWPAGRHLESYRLSQVGGATQDILGIQLAKVPFLV
jgi:hypothetical protein